MPNYPVSQPFKPFTGLDGLPLEGGYIYYGVANQNPETARIQVYWDVNSLVPAAQPIRTVAGYPTRNGSTPAIVYASGDFSVTVKDSAGALILTSPNSVDYQLVFAAQATPIASAISLVDAGGYFAINNVEAALQELGPLLAALSGAVTGEIKDYAGRPTAVAAPAGYVYSHGNTIGNAASGATTVNHRGNADCQTLFVLLWENFNNGELPIRNTDGSAGTRNSAVADFNAGMKLPTPDCRGRSRAGFDQSVPPIGLGAPAAISGRLTAAGTGNSGVAGATLGASGGVQTHALIAGQAAPHNHTFTGNAHGHTIAGHTHNYLGQAQGNMQITANTPINTAPNTYGAGTTGAASPALAAANTTATGTISTLGAATAHQNTQPTIVLSAIIKL